jgi:hypothetical protein
MNSILRFPPLLQFVLVFVIFGFVGGFGPALVRQRAKGLELKDHHDVLGMMFSVAAAFYGVVLAFVIVAAWQDFQDAAQREQVELLSLTELYEVGVRLPMPTRQLMSTAIRGYLSDSLTYEWSDNPNPSPTAGRGDLKKMLAALLSLNPQSQKEGILYGKAMDQITRLFEARQQRFLYSQSNIPRIVWLVIIFGAGVTISLSFFFFTQHHQLQAMTSMLFAMLIGLTIIAIYDLSHPYQGYTRIAPTGFRELLVHIDSHVLPPEVPAAPAANAPALIAPNR